MKRLFTAVLVLFGLSSLTLAQSGRKIAPAPKPTPAVDTSSADPDFSESIPVKPRLTTNRSPIFRSVETAPAPTTTTTGGSPTAVPEGDVVKVETNLVTIPVSVYDHNGIYISGLRQEDFKIFEDGKEQQIAYFATVDKPFTVILLLDTSPSTALKIEDIRASARAFVDQLKIEDKVQVITFDLGVHVHGEATSDREEIYKNINKASFGGGTSLYEAVDIALRKQLAKIDGRKAIVLFTDGVDTTSTRAHYEDTIDEAEESEALIFPIYFNTFFDTRGGLGGINAGQIPSMSRTMGRGTSAEEYARGRHYLDDLAMYTGGRVFRPDSTPGGLTSAFEGIADELRRQYNIGYVPQDEGTPGQRKQIKVRVDRSNVVVRNRDSYIVGVNAKPTAAATQKPN
jgi:VWFA-related protein